jgi:hypothetical protein
MAQLATVSRYKIREDVATTARNGAITDALMTVKNP